MRTITKNGPWRSCMKWKSLSGSRPATARLLSASRPARNCLSISGPIIICAWSRLSRNRSALNLAGDFELTPEVSVEKAPARKPFGVSSLRGKPRFLPLENTRGNNQPSALLLGTAQRGTRHWPQSRSIMAVLPWAKARTTASAFITAIAIIALIHSGLARNGRQPGTPCSVHVDGRDDILLPSSARFDVSGKRAWASFPVIG